MDAARFKPGDALAGEYRIDRLIGAGGFARVYRAVQTGLDRRVALKVLRPQPEEEGSPSRRAAERFQREAQLMSQLQNPHTVTLYDYGRLDDGRFYMVMEYVDGRTVSQLVEEEGPVGVDRLVSIWKQVLDSLREAHAVGIVHRDIKPTNIMVYDRVGQPDAVKLLDFGIAKSVADENRNDRELTTEGAAVGTPKYMSPEQLLGRPLTPASDLFSVGVLGYLLYDGDVPYRSTQPSAILDRMKRFDSDIGALEEIGQPVRGVARKLLAPDVEDRFQKAEEVLEALDAKEAEYSRSKVAAGAGGGGAAFPMGLDREGGTDSTELTFVPDAESGAESPGSRSGIEEVDPGTPVNTRVDDSGVNARGGAGPDTGTVPPEPSQRTPRSERSTAQGQEGVQPARGGALGWQLIATGALLVLAGVLGYELWRTGPGDRAPAVSGSTEVDAEESGGAAPEPSPSEPERTEALDAARRIGRAAVTAGVQAVENSSELEDDATSETTESGDERDPAGERPPSPTREGAAESGAGEAGGEPAPTGGPPGGSGASEASESGVEPLDEVDDEEDSEKSNELEVEPWE